MTQFQKLQQKIWRFIYRFFPILQKAFLVFHKKDRQRFHIGWLHPEKTLADLKKHLADTWGFGNHFIAWEDTDQVLSWRKLTSFKEQFHLRVYKDGEVRGHYELTPEAAPIKHFVEDGEESKKNEFLKFLEGFLSHERTTRTIEPDTTVPTPDAQITFEDSSQGK